MCALNITRSKNKEQLAPLCNSSFPHIKEPTTNTHPFLKELGLTRKQFHLLFDNIPQGISLNKILCDSKGNMVDFIKLESNSSYDKINFSPKSVWLNGSKKAKDPIIDWIGLHARVAFSGLPENIEACCKSENKWYKATFFSPKKGFLISVFVDVTKERKFAQDNADCRKTIAALISTEKRYRRLYQTTQDGIMARDLNGKMIDCNQAYAKMLGFTKKELKQKTVQELLPEKWHDQREKIIQKVLRTGRSILFEREYKRKDGSIFSSSVRTWPLTDGKGKSIGLWSIVRDINEQKQHQKNLEDHADTLQKIVEERTKQLKDSERLATIGQTAGMVGHDLRNPLQTVIGELFLAKSEVDSLTASDSKKSLQESIQLIEEQVIYMNKIISDLQAFVQPVKLDKIPVDLNALISGVVSSIAVPDNVIVRTFTPIVVAEVKADLQLLRRVLINLTTNAVQAMPNGGTLTITANITPHGNVYVTVQDTGVGIPEKIKKLIFTPLFTTKSRGQGFGLAVCKRVMEAHCGTISFESIEGKGAEFTIKFPAN